MFFDRNGDRANLDYGHPFKLDVPSYAASLYWAETGFRYSHTCSGSLHVQFKFGALAACCFTVLGGTELSSATRFCFLLTLIVDSGDLQEAKARDQHVGAPAVRRQGRWEWKSEHVAVPTRTKHLEIAWRERPGVARTMFPSLKVGVNDCAHAVDVVWCMRWPASDTCCAVRSTQKDRTAKHVIVSGNREKKGARAAHEMDFMPLRDNRPESRKSSRLWRSTFTNGSRQTRSDSRKV
eukprot:1179640-Rhodomonas_salina.4